jgi:hypothetical protein
MFPLTLELGRQYGGTEESAWKPQC